MPCLYVTITVSITVIIDVSNTVIVSVTIDVTVIVDVPVSVIGFVQNQYPMNMIWHYHKFTQYSKWRMIRDLIPIKIGNISCFGQNHFTIRNFPEKMSAVPGTDSDKIRTVPTIIPPLSPC